MGFVLDADNGQIVVVDVVVAGDILVALDTIDLHSQVSPVVPDVLVVLADVVVVIHMLNPLGVLVPDSDLGLAVVSDHILVGIESFALHSDVWLSHLRVPLGDFFAPILRPLLAVESVHSWNRTL